MTLKLKGDLDTLKMYRHTENKAASLRHSQLKAQIGKSTKMSQGQRSRSNVTNFEPLLAFTMGRIPTKLHQFPISSFRDFLRTNSQTDVAKNNTCS